MNSRHFVLKISFLYTISVSYCYSQQSYKDRSASLLNDTLVIQNSKIRYTMLWNDGDFIPYAIADGSGNNQVTFVGKEPGFDLVNASFENREIQIKALQQSIHAPAHLRVEVLNEHAASVKVKRIFKIFTETSAITMETHLKYGVLYQQADTDEVKLDGTESFFKQSPDGKEPYLQRFG